MKNDIENLEDWKLLSLCTKLIQLGATPRVIENLYPLLLAKSRHEKKEITLSPLGNYLYNNGDFDEALSYIGHNYSDYFNLNKKEKYWAEVNNKTGGFQLLSFENEWERIMFIGKLNSQTQVHGLTAFSRTF